MRIGLVDVGGGLRGIYSSGILDYCLDKKIEFDLCIGVSAGSANIITYLAHQRGRNYRFYTEYSKRSEYMSLKNYIKTGSFINMEYIYNTLSGQRGESPFDYNEFSKGTNEFLVVATNALTGMPCYFTRDDISLDNYAPLAASSSIPGINNPYEVNGSLYFDGGLSDPVPIKKAFSMGCDKVILILTKPSDKQLKESPTEILLAKYIKNKYPEASSRLMDRINTYNSSVELARKYEKIGRLLILSPDNIDGVSTLARRGNSLDRLYEMGYRDGEKILSWLR